MNNPDNVKKLAISKKTCLLHAAQKASLFTSRNGDCVRQQLIEIFSWENIVCLFADCAKSLNHLK